MNEEQVQLIGEEIPQDQGTTDGGPDAEPGTEVWSDGVPGVVVN